MFADVAGSTHLYELMGDEFARGLIARTLQQLSEIVSSHHGNTIKTIGDEIMCSFPAADNAILAAKQMHEHLADKTVPAHDYNLAIRVGAHHGPIIETDGDIFGDTVNVSARVASLARAGKTMITEYTYNQLPTELQCNCRHMMQTTVKGKEQPIDIFDVMWEQNDELTSIAGHVDMSTFSDVLTLQYQETVIKMSFNTVTLVSIGRGKECNLVIPTQMASREHCKIVHNLGKFTLADHSTNGTYIQHDNTELFFHQEKTPLIGSGVISLGESTAQNEDFLLNYSIESSKPA
jgi:hypothetical protein